MEEGKTPESHLTSAAAFVEGGIQEACDDSCSICLEDFSDGDPSTVLYIARVEDHKYIPVIYGIFRVTKDASTETRFTLQHLGTSLDREVMVDVTGGASSDGGYSGWKSAALGVSICIGCGVLVNVTAKVISSTPEALKSTAVEWKSTAKVVSERAVDWKEVGFLSLVKM